MKHLVTSLILCFVMLGSSPSWSVARADEDDKSPAVETKSTTKEAPKKEKEKDAKQEKADAKKPAKAEEKKADKKKAKDAKKKADDDKTKAKTTAKKKVAPPVKKLPVHEVEKGPFQVTVALKGIFEAKRMAEVSVWPEQWSGFKVLKAVEHGKQVKQGDLLIAFDPEKIDQALDDLRRQAKLTDIQMRKLQEQLDAMEKLAPMDLAAVDRRKRITEEDFEQLMKVDLPASKERAEFSLKMIEEYVAYAKEELKQLEKMYKADDLTEETEEIILRRARFQVKMYEFYYKLSKLRHDEMMKFSLPRREESAKDSIKRSRLSIRKTRILLPLALKKGRLEMEKAKVSRERLAKKLKELSADRKLMTVKSPADGIVYFGECVDGRWTGMTSKSRFKRGASLPTKSVLMTVLKTQPILIRSAATEKDVRYVREGLKGKVRPTAYPKVRFEAIVSEVDSAPSSSNRFDVKLMVTDQSVGPVMPGMTCMIKLVPYKKKNALTIPPTALGTDPEDDMKHFVYVVDKKGKPKKRKVKVGERTVKAVEILKGLRAGDKVLKVCPKEDPNKAKKKPKKKPEKKCEKKPEKKPENKK